VGRVIGIQQDEKDVSSSKKGAEVCVKIEQPKAAIPQITYGRHFDHTNELVSLVCCFQVFCLLSCLCCAAVPQLYRFVES